MRDSVAKAWPAMCRKYEGVTTWMYLDTKGLVTTGIGFLIDSTSAAQRLPWLTKDGKLAASTQIASEWRRVKDKQSWKRYNGLNLVWKNSAVLHLDDATVDSLLKAKTDEFWTRLKKTITKIEEFPADAQLALMDESWQNGPAFLDVGSAWTGTRASVLAQDWSAAASHVPGSGDRANARKRLFNNAAKVVKLKLDPNILWDTKTPVAPVVVPTPTPPVPSVPVDVPPATDPVPSVPTTPPVVTPPALKVLHNKTYGDYVVWRGENFPPNTVKKLQAVPHYVGVIQGGLSFATASAKTHAGLGVGDESVRGFNKDEVWNNCKDLWEVNILPAPRGFVSDSFQGKSVSNINDGNEHIHWLDLDEVEHMHPQAQAQVKEMLAGGDGLLGNAHFTGPGKEYRTEWKDSMYNPINVRLTPGVFYVQTDTLVGLNSRRQTVENKVKGDRISFVKQVNRWGRWNVVTVKGTFFAISDSSQTYLSEVIPVEVKEA